MPVGPQESTHRPALARLALGALLLVTACGGDAATATAGKSVARVELTIPDSAMLVGDSIIARAEGFDASGSPVPDATVRWSSSDGSIVLVSTTGVARARALGVVRIRATMGGAFAERRICVHRDAARAVVESGDAQTATILSEAPVLPVVRFVDAAGLPAACVRVEISSTPSAAVTPRGTITDDDGRVYVTRWTLAPRAGTQTVSFTASNGVTTSVRMTGVPGPPAKLTGPADMTTPGYMGQSLGRFSVQVTDIGDNPLAGVPVSFTAVGAKPSLSASSVATDQAGAAGVDVRLDTVGTATVEASVAGIAPFVFRVSATGFRATSIVMGGHRACGARANGAWYCWGYERARPAPFTIVSPLTIGAEHVCGVGPPLGRPFCSGGNRSGELGLGFPSDPPPGYAVDTLGDLVTPVQVGNVSAIFAGFQNTCAIASMGQIWCWGSNANGVLGDPAITPSVSAPLRLGIPIVFRTLQMNRTTVCGIDDRAVTYCWGRNGNGQVGDGTTTDRWTPTVVVSPVPFVSLSGGCALTADGAAYCWGPNASGSVGDGTTADRLVPTPVAGGLRFKSISTGNRINCGIASNDRLFCWGNGQLVPREVVMPNGRAVTAVATAEASVCVITLGDEVFCWGANDRHELGDGTTIARAIPVPVLPTIQ